MAAARILVVDDEPVVRQLVSSVLTCSGYEVLSAPSGEAALEILKAAPHLDLVLSDVTMPGLQGPELLEQAKQISPSTALMLMSAFPPPATDPVGFISKPFRPRDLIARVEHVLRDAAQARKALSESCDRARKIQADSERICLETEAIVDRATETLKSPKSKWPPPRDE